MIGGSGFSGGHSLLKRASSLCVASWNILVSSAAAKYVFRLHDSFTVYRGKYVFRLHISYDTNLQLYRGDLF